MGYITVAHRKILRQLDSISYFPNGWDKFVKELNERIARKLGGEIELAENLGEKND